MARIFKPGCPNFPADQEELNRRLEDIEKLINNDNHVSYVNIKFVETAFQLMQDCDLITQDNIDFLINWKACRQFDERFKFLRNPYEGVLRLTDNDNDVFDRKGFPRFYSGRQRYVASSDKQRLLISNDWYNDASVCPNKRQFFNWLKAHAIAACKAYWDNTGFDDVPNPFPGDAIDDSIFSTDEATNLTVIIQSLDDLHEKIDELNEKVEKLYELWK